MSFMERVKKRKILYFSRGRGFSHAMNDILIIRQLEKINKDLEIQIDSYAQGFMFLKKNGFEAFDLDLKLEEEASPEIFKKIKSRLNEIKPDLVVSDEFFMALPMARKFGIPSIFISNWFFEEFYEWHPLIPVVKKANHIIFVDRKEFHNIPSNFNVPISFVGPIVREFKYTLKNKSKVREELEIGQNDRVILVTAGGRSEERNELLDLNVEVFKKLNLNNLKMILLTGNLYHEYSKSLEDEKGIIVKDFDWDMDRLMVASDIVICKGTYSTAWELIYLGIPSICFPDDENPVDKARVSTLAELNIAVAVNLNNFNVPYLLEKAKTLLNSKEKREQMSRNCLRLAGDRGQKNTATVINDYICNKI